jgi:hypothetical protein
VEVIGTTLEEFIWIVSSHRYPFCQEIYFSVYLGELSPGSRSRLDVMRRILIGLDKQITH